MPRNEHQHQPSRKPRRVLSYANVVATLALVFAIGGGSAYAAKHYLITSTKQIKPSVVTALRRTTAKLGTTGPTGTSGSSGSVGGTTTGTGLVRWRTTAATAGASPTAPTIVTLATDGPFTITGECFSDGSGNTEAGTYIQTSQDGAAVESGDNGETVPLDASDGAVEVDDTYASGVTATNSEDFEGADGGSWAAESVDGSISLQGLGAQGVWMQGPSGPACSFSGFLVGE
jgi:hypothetical protein